MASLSAKDFPIKMNKFTLTGRLRSIRYALEGLLLMLKTQPNAWIHLLATTIVVLAGFYYEITATHWAIITLTILSVWVAETLNTAFEYLCDVTNPEFHPIVKKAKDISAGAVLISALGAIIIGLIIFLPYT
jgi:diacylglycerol kinase (ATP)